MLISWDFSNFDVLHMVKYPYLSKHGMGFWSNYKMRVGKYFIFTMNISIQVSRLYQFDIEKDHLIYTHMLYTKIFHVKRIKLWNVTVICCVFSC